MPQLKEILVYHHSHTDIGYTHPQPVLWELQRRFIDEAIDLCEQTGDRPGPSRVRWTCETTMPLLHWLKYATGRQIDRFRALVRAGQMGAGAMPLNITPLYDAEQLARNLEPLAHLRRDLGLPLRVAMNHDVNGWPWPIVGLLLDAGIELAIMGINIHFGGYPLTRPLAFHWKGPDGRTLLAYNGEQYQGFDRVARASKASISEMAVGIAEYDAKLREQKYPYDFACLSATHHSFPDNNPPDPVAADLIQSWNAEGRLPAIRYALPEEIAARFQPYAAAAPVHSGDWTDYWNFGCASSAAETRANRHTRSRLMAADAIRATLAPAEPDAQASRRSEEAWRFVDLYDEHTWGAQATIQTKNADPVTEQWTHKAGYAYQAKSLSAIVLRDALDGWAGNIPQTRVTAGVLVYNPSPVQSSHFVRIPRSIAENRWEHHASTLHGLDYTLEMCDDSNSVLVGPIQLPSRGWQFLPLSELVRAAISESDRAEDGLLETQHHRLQYDRTTGRVTSLEDLKTGAQIIDDNSPWTLFGPVRERPNPTVHPEMGEDLGRDALFEMDWTRINAGLTCWHTDWQALRARPTQLLYAGVGVVPEGPQLTLTWVMPGCVGPMTQRITLRTDKPVIELEASFVNQDVRTADALYFTFPLRLPNWRASYDTADIPTQFDGEQLKGVCRDYITVGHWAAVYNQTCAVTLACPDAPMIQFGDFNFGRLREQFDSSAEPLLLAWPLNNYWNTNFRASQPGPLRFRYELRTHSRYSPSESVTAGLDAAHQFLWHPLTLGSPPNKDSRGSTVDVSGEGVYLLHVRPVRTQDATSRTSALRLINVSESETVATVRIAGGTLENAELTSPVLDNGTPLAITDGQLTLCLEPRSVTTVMVTMRRVRRQR